VKKVSSNDPAVLRPGQAQYTCFPNGKGGIVDDLLVYCFDSEKYLMVVNASNIQKDWEWVNIQNEFDAELENVSDKSASWLFKGPEAAKTYAKTYRYKFDRN
jgi:aminomethyltransferase